MVGGFVAFGINLHSTGGGVPHSVYIIFIIIQCCSVAFASMLLPASAIRRKDGTALAKFEPNTIKQSLGGLITVIMDWRVMLLIPAFFSAEVFLVLQSSLNAYAYNLRTRSLNNVLTNIFQIPFTFFVGYILDSKKLGSRKTRGLTAVTFVAVWVTGTYIAQTIWLSSWNFDRSIAGPAIDWTDSSYPGAVIIYLCYGAQYGMFQNTILWILGTLTNQPARLGHMVGLFVSVLSAGTATAFGIDATATNYKSENGAYFALATISFPVMFFVCWKCTTDTNYFKEDDVIAPMHVRLEHEHESPSKIINGEEVEEKSELDNQAVAAVGEKQ
jgi:hypothetical protein